MARTIGVLAAEHLAVGLIEDNRLVGPLGIYPEKGSDAELLQGMPAESISERIREQIERVSQGEKVLAIGVGFPGIIRDGIVQDSPNLQQVKGYNLQATLSPGEGSVPVRVFNDADVMAAGIAADKGHLDRLVRVWHLGNGIGYGRYPCIDGVWEGGHMVVTLDPRERYCGCGGVGHLEGIMGHRSIRLRFLEMEPDEVFAAAAAGDDRCGRFVKLWHRALAAATATHIHLEGPGRFFITGPNAKYIELNLLNMCLQEMVKMSPLQGALFEVIPTGDEIGVLGAAVNAERSVLKA